FLCSTYSQVSSRTNVLGSGVLEECRKCPLQILKTLRISPSVMRAINLMAARSFGPCACVCSNYLQLHVLVFLSRGYFLALAFIGMGRGSAAWQRNCRL